MAIVNKKTKIIIGIVVSIIILLFLQKKIYTKASIIASVDEFYKNEYVNPDKYTNEYSKIKANFN